MPKSTPDNDTERSFEEIAAAEGEETAITAGIAADPDTEELDDAWFASARPAAEVYPEIVARLRRGRGTQKAPRKQRVTVRLDADIMERLRAGGRGWQTRLNDTLRRALFGS